MDTGCPRHDIGCMALRRLEATDRAFLERAARAAFTNPFGEEWEELDPGAVRDRITALERARRADVRLYEEQDRETLAYAFLFDAYYACADAFDELIHAELEANAGPGRVGFAEQQLSALRARGF